MSHSPHRLSPGSGLVVLASVLLLTTGAFAAQGQTPPVLDGNINDLILYAEFLDTSGQGCGLNILDPPGDIVVADPMVIPCDPAFVQGVSTYFINGFDHTLGLVALSGNTLYLGIRVVGVIGDPDGNGDPDTNCPLSTVQDAPGIEEAATYEWRFDTDCDDIFESIITVKNNTVSMTGITGNASFDFDGSDIEVHVANVSLAPLFQARTFSGHREDGLGEDISDQAACPPPEILVTLLKTVNPASVCPGQSTTVTLEVCNPNAFSLSGMALDDALPAGFTYVPGSVTGIGPPTGMGTLVFPAFDLTPFQCRTITFQVTAPQDCFGEVPNIATVVSNLTNACLPPPGFITSVASDTAFIDCLPVPTCSITGPETVCTGATGNLFTIASSLAGSTFSTVISGNGTIVGSSTGTSINVTAGAAGSFTLTTTVVANGCSSTCTKTVTVTPQPTCLISGPDALCTGSTATYTVTSSIPDGCITIQVSGNGIGIPPLPGPCNGTATVNVTAGAAGTFTITATVTANGCSSTCVRTVTVSPQPTCTINGPIQVCAGSTGNLFTITDGLAGATYLTVISGNGTIVGSSTGTSINVTAGAAGSFTLTTTVVASGCTATCTRAVTVEPVMTCDITGPLEICPGSTTTFTVTGLQPGTFHWIVSGDATISGANNMGNVSVLAGASGSFSLSVVLNVTTPCATGCTINRTISETCVVNCPRTAGFWTQQCEQKKGGSTKFTVDQMNQITACVDQQVNFFSWGNDFDSFCSIVNPDRQMTQRKQALRQFAVLVANVCADQQNQVMGNGDEIVLDLNTPVHYAGFTATTIGELIAEIDARLALLAGGSASDHGYGAIISVADGINNGYGIGRTCNEDDDMEDDDSAASNLLSVGYDAAVLNQASPNPFRTATRIQYTVNGDAAQDVSVDVYNISGRLVRRLESGSKSPGRYESEWNGRSDAGESVAGGVYFIRIVTGSTQATSRVLYVK